VLQLPRQERARLAEEVLTSLEEPDEEDVAAAWAHELERAGAGAACKGVRGAVPRGPGRAQAPAALGSSLPAAMRAPGGRREGEDPACSSSYALGGGGKFW
jgi:hypothetical protein